MNKDEFSKFASKDRGISSMTLYRYSSAVDAYINPTITEERKLNVAQMAKETGLHQRQTNDYLSVLGQMGVVFFLRPYANENLKRMVKTPKLYFYDTGLLCHLLYLNTPGGQVSSGLGIYDTMQIIQPDVATICTGMAASMGSVLLCAGAKGKRSALPHSRVLIHQPLGGAQGQASDILIAAKEIEKTREELFRIISSHTGQPYEKVAADGERDYWMSASEALSYGMVDEILSGKKK